MNGGEISATRIRSQQCKSESGATAQVGRALTGNLMSFQVDPRLSSVRPVDEAAADASRGGSHRLHPLLSVPSVSVAVPPRLSLASASRDRVRRAKLASSASTDHL